MSCFINKIDKSIIGSTEVVLHCVQIIVSVFHVEKLECTLCVWLDDKSQEWLPFGGVVVKENTMPIKTGLKTIWSPGI